MQISSFLSLINESGSGFLLRNEFGFLLWNVFLIDFTYRSILFVHIKISWGRWGLFDLLKFFLFNHRLWYFFNFRFWFFDDWLLFYEDNNRLRFMWAICMILKRTTRNTAAHLLATELFSRCVFRLIEIGNDLTTTMNIAIWWSLRVIMLWSNWLLDYV